MSNDLPVPDESEAESYDLVANEVLIGELRKRTEAAEQSGVQALSNIDFQRVDLSEAFLSNLRLEDVGFDDAILLGATFESSWLSASFERAKLRGARFCGATIDWADFTDADLAHTDFRGASIDAVDFTRADLSHAIFDGSVKQTNFLAAADVSKLDVSDVLNLTPRTRVRLHNRGAIAHSGLRCPNCERYDGYPERGLRPFCMFCDGEGWGEWDPDELTERCVVECPWCSGIGYVSHYMGNESRCLACEGLGMVGAWVIDRNRHEYELPDDFDEYKTEYDELGSFTIDSTDLARLKFVRASVQDTEFQNCSLEGSDFSGTRLTRVDFRHCDLSEANFTDTKMNQVRFINCKMPRMVWKGGGTRQTSVLQCDLTGAVIDQQRLRKVLRQSNADQS